jgi:hypothetical protein
MGIFNTAGTLLTLFQVGSSLFGGKSATDSEHGHGYDGGGRSVSALGFLQKGASMFLESQKNADGSRAKAFSQAPDVRPRSISQLTRGTPMSDIDMPPLQQQLYQAPEVSRYWETLMNSNNPHVSNLRAAAGVDVQPTVASGRKTQVLSKGVLKGEVGIT